MKKLLIASLFFLLTASTVFAQYQELYFINPQSGWQYSSATITENIFSVKEKGFFYEVNLYLSFKATEPQAFDSDTQIEMVTHFNLPEEYAVSNLWLWVGDQIMEARIYDKWTARRIYEDIVDRRKDPALLIKHDSRSYELRIYPFKPDQERKIRLSFLIPQNRNQDIADLVLPYQIQQLAEFITVDPKVMYWSNIADPDIQIANYESTSFENEVVNGEQYWSAEIPVNHRDDELTFQQLIKDDSTKIFVYEEGNEKYYSLSFVPATLIDTEQSTNVLILFDLVSDDSRKIQAIINTTRSKLKAQLDSDDKFNILISDFDVHLVSDTWLTADHSTIDSTFDSIDIDDAGNLSNLDNLLLKGVEFIRENGLNGDMLLIASSQEYNSLNQANSFLDGFFNYLGDDEISISVSDIIEQNINRHWTAGRYYYGNEYLYSNLTRDTGGEFYSLYLDGSSIPEIIQSGLASLQNRISSAESFIRPLNGFTYGRYSNSSESESFNLYENFTQIGKFAGESPFTVEFSGFIKDSVFHHEFSIPAEEIGNTDSTLKRYWTAKRIHDLETGDPNNQDITEIINLSMDNRILSRYTAFLALEPSDSVAACTSCFDESELVSNEDDLLPESFEVDTLSAYPNPFNPAVNIQVKLSEVWNASNSSLEIYNILGQSVAKLNTDSFNGRKSFQIRWNVQDSGNISSGIYIVRLRTPRNSKTIKITYLK